MGCEVDDEGVDFDANFKEDDVAFELDVDFFLISIFVSSSSSSNPVVVATMVEDVDEFDEEDVVGDVVLLFPGEQLKTEDLSPCG